MWQLYIISFRLIFLFMQVQGELKVNKIVKGKMGHAFNINCLAFGEHPRPPPNIFWKHGATTINVPINDSMYEASGIVLQIKNLSEQSFGDYTCDAWYNSYSKVYTTRVEQDIPGTDICNTIISTSTGQDGYAVHPKTVVVKDETKTTLICLAFNEFSATKDTLCWYHNNMNIKAPLKHNLYEANGIELQIKQLDNKTYGHYKCIATETGVSHGSRKTSTFAWNIIPEQGNVVYYNFKKGTHTNHTHALEDQDSGLTVVGINSTWIPKSQKSKVIITPNTDTECIIGGPCNVSCKAHGLMDGDVLVMKECAGKGYACSYAYMFPKNKELKFKEKNIAEITKINCFIRRDNQELAQSETIILRVRDNVTTTSETFMEANTDQAHNIGDKEELISSSSTIYTIFGASVISIVILIIVALLIVYVRHRRKRSKKDEEIYDTANYAVTYAELDIHTRSQVNLVSPQEETPYAEIVGVLHKQRKNLKY